MKHATLSSDYHWRDGWFFRRELSGDVTILRTDRRGEMVPVASIPANEWASIVHHTAAPGADFYAVRALLSGSGPVEVRRDAGAVERGTSGPQTEDAE